MKEDVMQTFSHYFLNKNLLISETKNNIEYIKEDNIFFAARSLGKTAENLYLLYQFVMNKFDEAPKNIVVGIGPGSFTGLRLGCAFANGLSLSAGANLFSVRTTLRDEIVKILENKKELLFEYQKELIEYQESDMTSGCVTFFDLFYALHLIQKGNIIPCQTLIPQYGRDPTPMIKLRKEQS